MPATQVLPFGVEETAISFGASGTVTYSTGIELDNPQYFGLAAHVTISGTLGGFEGSIVVQTRANPSAGSGIVPGNTDWVDTDAVFTVAPVSLPAVYQIAIPVPVLDAVRLKLVRTVGTSNLTWRVRWMADQDVAALE
jgi:hypothetical protein